MLDMSYMLLAGAPIMMLVNIYAGELPIRKTCDFDKPLNHILKVMGGCMHIFCSPQRDGKTSFPSTVFL